MTVDVKVMFDHEFDQLRSSYRMDIIRSSGTLQRPTAQHIEGYDVRDLHRWVATDNAISAVRRMTPYADADSDSGLCMFLLGFFRPMGARYGKSAHLAITNYLEEGYGPLTSEDVQYISNKLVKDSSLDNVSWLLGFRMGVAYKEVLQFMQMLPDEEETTDE